MVHQADDKSFKMGARYAEKKGKQSREKSASNIFFPKRKSSLGAPSGAVLSVE